MKRNIKTLNNKDLLDEILSLYSKDDNYEKYYLDTEANLFNDEGIEYARALREEILSRMIDSNAERFGLFGVIDKSTGNFCFFILFHDAGRFCYVNHPL